MALQHYETFQSLLEYLRRVAHWIAISWAFIRYDFTVTVILGLEWTITAWFSAQNQLSISDLCGSFAKSFLYFWFYALTHCTQNQLDGEEEDKLNKPDRPLPKGLCSRNEATFLRDWSHASFLFLGWHLGVFPEAVLWILVIQIGGMWTYLWWVKNLYCVVGYYSLLSAAWKITGIPFAPDTLSWMIMIPLITFILVPVQDLRDVDGDAKIGRKTLPLVIGDYPTRLVLTMTFGVITPIILYYFLALNLWGNISFIINALISVWLSYRIFFLKTKQEDHDTYLWYVLWMGLIELNAISVL